MNYDLNKLSVPGQLELFAENAKKIPVSFVSATHMEAIAEYCQKNKIALSIRETGEFSLMRIAQGAKAKPHSMLQKTIKPGSLRKKYPEIADILENTDLNSSKELLQNVKIEGVPVLDLLGFVGHWSEDGTLLGVGLNKNDILNEENKDNPELEKIQDFITIDTQTNEPYIKLSDFNNFKEEIGDNWVHHLYTGDYDLGEIYKNGKPLMEGSVEKARVLKGLNEAIARSQQADQTNKNPIRRGSFTVKRASFTKSNGRTVSAHLLHPEKGSEYAMIQHGDQMGYLTNQINEAIAKEREARIALRKSNKENNENILSPKRKKAELVRSVSEEPEEALAWCIKGEWFITQNRAQHKVLRQANDLKVSSGWNDKTKHRISENKSKVFKYKN